VLGETSQDQRPSQTEQAPFKSGVVTISGKLDDEVPRMTEYLIIIEKAENNYAAYCQDLPGVIATGPTRKEALELMKEAIEFHLEGPKAESLNIPEPTTIAASVEVSL
jgi:predicted RNase H-like HicB family nuclease